MDTSGTLAWYDFAAGWFSGMCGLLVGHPADTVKVQQQTSGNRGALDVIVTVLRTQGPLAFYKGLMMPLISAGIINATFFGCYGNSVRIMAHLRDQEPARSCCSNDKKLPYNEFHWDIFRAGCAAGCITTFIACPFDLVKIKLQSQAANPGKRSNEPLYTGTLSCLVSLFQTGGIRHIYKGLVPMLWRDIFSSGIYMYLYAVGNKRLSETKSVSSVMISGAFAGVLTWIGVMPVDVIKSRIQADDADNPKYKGMIDCFRKTYKEYGLPFFMRGFFITMVRAVPVNAATFAGYEAFLFAYFKLTEK